MRAALCTGHGRPADVVELIDESVREPGPDEVVVAIEAAPIHLSDIYYMRGVPGFTQRVPPYIPGRNGVGRVTAAGSNAGEFPVGSRVFLPRFVGSWRQRIVIEEKALQPAPEGVPAEQLALVSGNLMTSYFLLKGIVTLNPGDWVLQNAANSNCGLYVARLARAWNLRTVNVVRREAAIAPVLNAGGDLVFLDGEDLAKRIGASPAGGQIRLALDPVAGAATARIGACLGNEGTLVLYGLLSSETASVRIVDLMFNGISVVGYYNPRLFLRRSASDQRALYVELGRIVSEEAYHAPLAAVYSIEEISVALEHAEKVGSDRPGKIVIRM